MGRERSPCMNKLMITADGGSSDGWRVRLFKVELQKLGGTAFELEKPDIVPNIRWYGGPSFTIMPNRWSSPIPAQNAATVVELIL